VRQDAIGISEQLHLGSVERKIFGAELAVEHQRAHVHLEFGGDVRGQALDFDFAGDDFKDATLLLDAGGLAEGVHWNVDAHADIHGDAEEVDVEQVAAERIDLPVFENGGFVLAGQVHLEKGVVASGRAENRADLLGVYRERDGFTFAAIKNGGNFASLAEALGLVFAPIGAGRSFYDDLCLSHAFIPSVTISKTLTA